MINLKGKKKNYSSIRNLIVAGGAALLLWIIIDAGKSLSNLPFSPVSGFQNDSLLSDLLQGIILHHPLSVLILQILVIILASRILGWLMSLINQPTVIGEIIAGIALGPSLLGLYFPEVTNFIFPLESLGNIEFLSQIGLILFMFIIGMELDINMLKKRASSAVFISNVSIVVPFVMGAGLSLYLFEDFAPEGTRFLPFAMFMGIALSITAFPVLARIVQERGITRTPLGMTAITCAAINDITAWGILALVVAIANAGAIEGALFTIFLSLLYIAVMLFIIRPLLNKIAHKYTVRETISKTVVALVLSTMLLSSWITEVIGIHALFGAFMAGVIIPDNARFKQIMSEKIEDVSLVLLLPLFFVYTGLRTQIGLLNEPGLWAIALLVIAVAVVGKFAGSAIASRLTGQTWKDSLMIGALMNTRGLIELVALNIGYDIGVLSPEIFTILVIVALVTTFMTGPLMALIDMLIPSEVAKTSAAGMMRVLIAFGPPEAGGKLTLLVNALFGGTKKTLQISALHLTPNTEISRGNAKRYEEEAFGYVRKVTADQGIEVKTMYRTADNVSLEIIKTANRGKYDLLLVGSSRPLLNQDETGGKARYFFDKAQCDVGLFIGKEYKEIRNILIITESGEENGLFNMAEMLNPGFRVDSVCLLPPSVPINGSAVHNFKQILPDEANQNYSEYDLIISTLDCYRDQRDAGADWVDGKTSILLISQAGRQAVV
ncbi:MAG: cation/H(+) antiporter [Bacteroidetes bacterium HGW-Bacteroidetes-11]|jgi:Kef-type K+ transport system membrane component KefB/nucleotide-binding universal stress UspA family protein|nr:MAG: cation/H(+) antiporter [Bacteroidetes bacterium HGW-Bacteroidetes-11]